MPKFIARERKIQIVTMFEKEEIDFLEKNVKRNIENRDSRSALLRHLVRQAMKNPGLLNPIQTVTP